MQVSYIDLVHIIIALTILLFLCHLFGYIFQRTRQPRVIGEILAGLVLGPTLLQFFWPQTFEFIFSSNEPTKVLLDIFYQLGLLHLMFVAGMEVNARVKKKGKEASVVSWIASLGTLIPFSVSFIYIKLINANEFLGNAHNELAFFLVFALSLSVTSIPVISRILHDLKLLNTGFARIILSAAVIEDVILYVVLAIALGMVGSSAQITFGLSTLLGLESNMTDKIIYHICATVLFFVLSLFLGPRLFRMLKKIHFHYIETINPLAFHISFMFLMSGIAILLGIAPMFGAFVAGIISRSFNEDQKTTAQAFENYSFAFFIPIYFAIVGIKLDLIHSFPIIFFLVFMAVGCLVKGSSVYLGARCAHESPLGSLNLAVAMNARGGPGIVIASLALDSKIINDSFYCVLVMLAIITSLLAGSWLDYVIRKKIPLS